MRRNKPAAIDIAEVTGRAIRVPTNSRWSRPGSKVLESILQLTPNRYFWGNPTCHSTFFWPKTFPLITTDLEAYFRIVTIAVSSHGTKPLWIPIYHRSERIGNTDDISEAIKTNDEQLNSLQIDLPISRPFSPISETHYGAIPNAQETLATKADHFCHLRYRQSK